MNDDDEVQLEGDYSNRLGERIIKNYNKSNNKRPQGLCYEVSYERVSKGAQQACGLSLTELSRDNTFGKLWGSLVNPVEEWLKVPEEYRAKGAPGAMAWSGLGELVESTDIWAGKLRPGALIQVWFDPLDYYNVKWGVIREELLGHSFIFLKYKKSHSVIIGMKIADQGYMSKRTVKKGDFGYWVGANIFCA